MYIEIGANIADILSKFAAVIALVAVLRYFLYPFITGK